MVVRSDVIVIGSGASAVHSVYSIVKEGYRVVMIDVGNEDTTYEQVIPNKSFSDIRREDSNQHRYFLGDNFEGISFGQVGTGPQVTPPRQYVLKDVEKFVPIVSSTFEAAESLAMGGLGGAWGAVCHPFLEYELSKCSLPAKELKKHYEIITKRIGISYSSDDLETIYGIINGLQPALEIDRNAEIILSCYKRKSKEFNRAGIYMGRPFLASLSQHLDNRAPHSYNDMDFWSNKGESVYRPDITVRELQQYKNFTYFRPYLVKSFSEEESNNVKVVAKSLKNEKYVTFESRRLILAAGALGTTRIVLRSLNQYDVPIPITCNRHTYIPCIHYRGLGKQHKDFCHSLAQLVMFYDPTGDGKHLVVSHLYSYRSLLIYNLLKESFLPYYESLHIMRSLLHGLVIFIIQHEDEINADKYCTLRRKEKIAEDDYLEIVFKPSREVLKKQLGYEKIMARYIRKLGCWPIKMVHPENGASVHYASQFPMTNENKPLTTTHSGLLRGTRNVYIADSSVLSSLPAKGLTLTLMANANRIGENIMIEL